MSSALKNQSETNSSPSPSPSPSYLTCPVCYDTYDCLEKTPRLFRCGHTCCTNCIKQLEIKGIYYSFQKIMKSKIGFIHFKK